MALDHVRVSSSISLQEDTGSGSGVLSETFSRGGRIDYGIGTGASKVNKQWNAERTLAGASETHDLTWGITTRAGVAVTFAKIRTFYAANTGNATITLGGGSNAITSIFGTTLILPPNTEVSLRTTDATAWAVVAGTGDQLQVAGTAGQTYEIALAGE